MARRSPRRLQGDALDERSEQVVEEKSIRFPENRSWYLYWLASIVWLPFLAPEIIRQLRAPAGIISMYATLILVGVFVVVYVAGSYRAARDLNRTDVPPYASGTRRRWIVAAALTGLGITISFVGREAAGSVMAPFIYTSAYVGLSFRPSRAAVGVACVLAVYLAIALALGLAFAVLAQAVFIICVTSFVTIVFVRSIMMNRRLKAAQAEISRLAVANERLRIARDLHDLLGHSLTSIRLKSELASRLVSSDPEAARAQMVDVGRVAGSTLRQVREAVSQYHRATLAGEIRAAAEILAASGIAQRIDYDPAAVGPIPGAQEAALALALREGVTNVVRHSMAESCAITVKTIQGTIKVEVIDDGQGGEDAPDGEGSDSTRGDAGNGIRGVRSRLEAVGGTCKARRLSPRGFSLTALVELPGGAGTAREVKDS